MSNEKVEATFHGLPEHEQVVSALRKRARREWLRGAAAPLGALVVGLVVGAALAQSPANETGASSGTSGSGVSSVSQGEGQCAAAVADADRIIEILNDGLKTSGQAFGAVAEGRYDDLTSYSSHIRANTARLQPIVESYRQKKEACS